MTKYRVRGKKVVVTHPDWRRYEIDYLTAVYDTLAPGPVGLPGVGEAVAVRRSNGTPAWRASARGC